MAKSLKFNPDAALAKLEAFKLPPARVDRVVQALTSPLARKLFAAAAVTAVGVLVARKAKDNPSVRRYAGLAMDKASILGRAGGERAKAVSQASGRLPQAIGRAADAFGHALRSHDARAGGTSSAR